jgi:hypothetical protein
MCWPKSPNMIAIFPIVVAMPFESPCILVETTCGDDVWRPRTEACGGHMWLDVVGCGFVWLVR